MTVAEMMREIEENRDPASMLFEYRGTYESFLEECRRAGVAHNRILARVSIPGFVVVRDRPGVVRLGRHPEVYTAKDSQFRAVEPAPPGEG